MAEGAEKKKKAKKVKLGEEKDECPIENIFILAKFFEDLEQDVIYKLLIQNQLSPDNSISLSKRQPQITYLFCKYNLNLFPIWSYRKLSTIL